ncbi:MAG TPA: fumarylacetoacetate hydrolase family protein [Burkholderiales bacterium]|jgi:2-keto-4-pentenoate hydratase|nr:fumarylacetoacetate hydrolase family protein [Burkholderiales bacterium]
MSVRAEEAAAALTRDHAGKRKFIPFARDYGAMDIAGAYAIQAAYVARLEASLGRRVGYKIGLTSRRMQQMCGVDHPNSGVVFEKRLHASGATLSLGGLVHLGLEFECCARLGRSLGPKADPYTLEEISAAVEAVAPAFEVIDDRNADYPLDLLSLIADNSWNEGNVLGRFRTSWPDLARARSALECDGKLIDEGIGRDVLGHPFEPLRWLANTLSAQGRVLKAGEIVLTGSWVTTRFPRAGEHYRHTIEGIGSVEVRLSA